MRGPNPDRPAVVLETLPNARFRVELEGGAQATVHASGPMRLQLVRAVPGERVIVELSPFDATKGRIVALGDGARGREFHSHKRASHEGQIQREKDV